MIANKEFKVEVVDIVETSDGGAAGVCEVVDLNAA